MSVCFHSAIICFTFKASSNLCNWTFWKKIRLSVGVGVRSVVLLLFVNEQHELIWVISLFTYYISICRCLGNIFSFSDFLQDESPFFLTFLDMDLHSSCTNSSLNCDSPHLSLGFPPSAVSNTSFRQFWTLDGYWMTILNATKFIFSRKVLLTYLKSKY